MRIHGTQDDKPWETDVGGQPVVRWLVLEAQQGAVNRLPGGGSGRPLLVRRHQRPASFLFPCTRRLVNSHVPSGNDTPFNHLPAQAILQHKRPTPHRSPWDKTHIQRLWTSLCTVCALHAHAVKLTRTGTHPKPASVIRTISQIGRGAPKQLVEGIFFLNSWKHSSSLVVHLHCSPLLFSGQSGADDQVKLWIRAKTRVHTVADIQNFALREQHSRFFWTSTVTRSGRALKNAGWTRVTMGRRRREIWGVTWWPGQWTWGEVQLHQNGGWRLDEDGVQGGP